MIRRNLFKFGQTIHLTPTNQLEIEKIIINLNITSPGYDVKHNNTYIQNNKTILHDHCNAIKSKYELLNNIRHSPIEN